MRAVRYHPLSLCLLAGLILGDLEQPGDIVVAKRLDVSDGQINRKTHVLKVAYDSLTPARKALLSRIACFRSPTTHDALKELAKTDEQSAAMLDKDLKDLVARGLLHHDSKLHLFDLHPIVRRYAYVQLTGADRDTAHSRLRDYFAAEPPKDSITCLEDLNPVIELYHHTVRTGQFDEAAELLRNRLSAPLYYQFGAYQLQIDLVSALFPDGEHNLPRLRDERAQAWMLNYLAICYSLSGQPHRAVPLFEADIAILQRLELKHILPAPLGNLGTQQVDIGFLRDAEANLRRRIQISQESQAESNEAVGHQELGWLLAYRGEYTESEKELRSSTSLWEKTDDPQGRCITEAYRAQRELTLLRSNPDSAATHAESALNYARSALELADEDARTDSPVERDYVRAHWVLGAAHRACGQHGKAELHLHEAVQRCRKISMVDYEADILIDLARLRAATDNPAEAKRLADEALLITERCGYVLQGADAHLELAKLALARDDKLTALDHAQQARELAACDGPPDYTYKVAYDEAGSLIQQCGED